MSGVARASAPRTSTGYLFQTHTAGHLFPMHPAKLSVVHHEGKATRVSGVEHHALHYEAL